MILLNQASILSLICDTVTATTFTGNLLGNSSTATALQTARTINGTSFNGTGNITTANWGTARTLTIGNTGKSVNGSGNVSWSLSEIGALPLSGGTMTGPLVLKSEQYNGNYGLNCANSNIIGVNSIIFQDNADNATEGISWWRTATTSDSLWSSGGVLYYTQNHTTATGTADGTRNTVIHSGNYTSWCAQAVHTHSYLPLSGGTLTGPVAIVSTTMNGAYNGLLVGDDCYIGDCNIANTIGLMGVTNNSIAYIKFGKSGGTLGFDGTNLVATNNISVPNLYLGTKSAWLSTLLDGKAPSSHDHGYITNGGKRAETASGTTGNASNTGLLYPSGMFMTETYNDSATPAHYGNILNLAGSGGSQLLLEWCGVDSASGHLYYRCHRDTSTGGWSQWVTLLDSANYTSYTVTKTGSGASGTWGINISGSSASCTGNAATSTYATTAHAMRTYAASGSSHGESSWLMNCKYNHKGDGRFWLYVGDGTVHQVGCDYATTADTVDGKHASDLVLLSSAQSCGLFTNLIGNNQVGNNLAASSLFGTQQVTFFTNWHDSTNFPKLYGNGMLLPGLDARYKDVLYMVDGICYIGKVTSGSIKWTTLSDSNHTHSNYVPTSGGRTTYLIVGGSSNTISKTGYWSLAVGGSNTINGDYSAGIGLGNTINSYYSLAVGHENECNNSYSIALGRSNTVSGDISIAIGYSNTITKNYTYAMGYNNSNSSLYGIALGIENTLSGTEGSFALGWGNKVQNNYSVLLGISNTSSATVGYGYAIGYTNSVTDSYAFGSWCTSLFTNSFATGVCNNAVNADSHFFMIGNGSSSAKSNAFRVTKPGVVYSKGSYNSSGADYAEYFEWVDGNENNEDRVGYFVTLDGDKIRKATSTDNYLGITSGNPCIIGNSDEDWRNRWVRDEFDRQVFENVKVPIMKLVEDEIDILDKDGNPTGKIKVELKEVESGEYKYEKRPVENPDYDPSIEYQCRADRPEWSSVGMMGCLPVRDDGTCVVNGYCKVTNDGTATKADEYIEHKTYRVMKRISDNVIKVLFTISRI